ncbi:PaaI family thioesterase [Terasakiella sp. A23]|uniref:PaaI family thioesterase n=1 Tax=Terasakiella sp. FCG-A23 TaxID=3080561 RepID=UPI0029530472|nr:PaaI family thioesterase [Terasakiella sp. A23]MDV7338522.1 PaaI family thioesterase [Terasakiella sp. A23]
MSQFQPRSENYIEIVQQAFAKQGFMEHLGVEMVEIQPGFCELHIPFKSELDQHHGYFHGGVIGTLADVSGGFAGYSLLAEGQAMLTVEYKLNIMAPGAGDYLKGVGRVVKHGRTLTVTNIDVYAVTEGHETHCACAIQTLMAVDV